MELAESHPGPAVGLGDQVFFEEEVSSEGQGEAAILGRGGPFGGLVEPERPDDRPRDGPSRFVDHDAGDLPAVARGGLGFRCDRVGRNGGRPVEPDRRQGEGHANEAGRRWRS